jgi:acyl carrier protein
MREEQVRAVLKEHGRLAVSVETLSVDSDLYLAGLTSLATVGVMLALEDQFNIEFPDRMLGRKTFESIASILECLDELIDK